ncbi:hypothetical protein L484_022945 [Morus notabilis]|uniref:CLAVATA3/ESR (CLE)-related protein 12 n=1 Tax=Morus notabilis TaxID=981085 RepID=W9QTG4_9ROSA|nr:CLAVATA3/ESR (CLE)-related protein 12 [Morus notabilis]EXB53977.1 hypothetical protein L484_022945 [Morus notabilis]
MALKFSHLLFFILWLSLLFLLFREFRNFKSKFKSKQNIANNLMMTPYSSISNIQYPILINSRKVLASNFDFTPFLNHHHHQKQQHTKRHRSSSPPRMPKPVEAGDEHDDHDGNEIDPRYGVEKRRVPTGPNPLHH